jgi:hypothetical protein
MTFRNWRYDEETLNHIIEKSPAALEAFNKTLKSIPQMAGLREPIENAVENMAKLSRDLLAAREYLKDADTENERLQARVEKLEGMIGAGTVINNQVPAQQPDPTRGFPARFSEGGPIPPSGTGAPPIDAGAVHGNSAAGNLS